MPPLTPHQQHELVHATYNDLMESIYPYLDYDQRFAQAICDTHAEPNIAVRTELVKDICKEYGVPYDRKRTIRPVQQSA